MFSKKYIFVLIGAVCLFIVSSVLNQVIVTKLKDENVKEEEFIGNLKTLTPEQVIYEHFNCKNEKDLKNLKLTLYEGKNSKVIWNLENIKSIKIIDIQEQQLDNRDKEFQQINNFTQMKIFSVEYEVQYHKEEQQRNGNYTWQYTLVKENEDSPWLIQSWGAG